jgi:hypothetical protein
MTKNKNYRKQLKSQYEALEEHLHKIEQEKEKSPDGQNQGLIEHWEKTVLNCHQQIAKLQRRLEK